MNQTTTTPPGCPETSATHENPRFSIDAITHLKERFPDSPFLALGQTALWDEPTKATLRRTLDTLWPEARMIAGAHDTDYFAKLPGHVTSAEYGSYALMLHDDARTRGLWSAAGEMSRLFGSEDVVTREMLRDRGGVTLHRALYGTADPVFTLSELTAAWGWTGIIYTEWDRKVVAEVPLDDILPTLLEQIENAMAGSADCLNGPRAEAARALADTVRNWVASYSRAHPGASLADLYQDILPWFYQLALGAPAHNLTTSRTSELLKFNTATCHLPRFALVGLFLSLHTRTAAEISYNLAVSGSDIYTLDQFGEGALPFDVVIPGRGRGTLRLPGGGTIIIDTPREPITLQEPDSDFNHVEQLAARLEREFGPDVTLVGKAVTLLPMLTAEHILVFHEGASAYAYRTHTLVTEMKRRGLPVPELRPILRLKYATWDAIAAVPQRADDDVLNLPEHLAQAFCRETIAFEEFATCHRYARERERSRLAELAELRSPRRLLEYLCRTEGDPWQERLDAHERATVALLEIRDRSAALQGQVLTLLDSVRRRKHEVIALEKAKGDYFRADIQPLRADLLTASPDEAAALEQRIATLEQKRHAAWDPAIARLLAQNRGDLLTIRDLKAQRKAVERGPEATDARATLRRIEGEAETEKARLAGNALRAIYGLEHTGYRPSSWWFPLVDPSGAWFQALTDTTQFYLEPLDS